MPQGSFFDRSIRVLTLAGATVTVGLMAGVFYAYAVSVNLGLAGRPDADFVATMNAINAKIQNPLFFVGFFGAALLPVAALAAHRSPRPLSRTFWLVALACTLYVSGSFAVTVFANVPLNEDLARIAADAPPGELVRARIAYEGAWNFWNGVRAVFSTLAFLTLVAACLSRDGRDGKRGAARRA